MKRLFRHADFRRLFFGRLVTNAGDSLYAVAAMWLVYDLTGSTVYTGLAGVLTMGPQALQVFVGPVVDRWPIRRTLVVTQLVQGVLVLTIPLAAFLGLLSAPLVLVVMPLVSLFNQFVYPAQTAVLPRIVEEDELTDANAAFTLAYQGVDMAFNGVAGVLVALVGATALFLIDSVTFGVAVALFAGLTVPVAALGDGGTEESRSGGTTEECRSGGAVESRSGGAAEGSGSSRYLRDLREGLSFVRGTVLVKLFGASVMANALLGSTWAVLPAFADARGGPGTYGLLLAGVAGGSLAGALVASRLKDVPYGRLSIAGFVVSALAWFAALAIQWTPATVVLFGLAFLPVGVTNVVATTMFQRLVPESLLGRVMALLGSGSTAAMPLGSFVGGLAGGVFSAGAVMVAGGVGFVWIAVYVLAFPSLRGLPSATEIDPIERDALVGAE